MDDTLWKHNEKKFKPINKQAALIVRKAHWLHQAPVEQEKVNKEPTLKERIEAQNKILMAKIVQSNKEADDRLERRRLERERKAQFKVEKPRVNKNKWAIRFLKQQAKSRGLPKPTLAECRAFASSQPGYGKLL